MDGVPIKDSYQHKCMRWVNGRLTRIERKHLRLRTKIKRLVRRTICFSKSEIMHDLVIGSFIHSPFLPVGDSSAGNYSTSERNAESDRVDNDAISHLTICRSSFCNTTLKYKLCFL